MSNTPAHTTKQQTKKKFIFPVSFLEISPCGKPLNSLLSVSHTPILRSGWKRKQDKFNLTVERLAGTWYYNGVVSLLIE